MAEGLLLVAESMANGDMYAAARFLTGDPVLWLEADGRTALVVTGFDLELASRQSPADEVWAVEELTSAFALYASAKPVRPAFDGKKSRGGTPVGAHQ